MSSKALVEELVLGVLESSSALCMDNQEERATLADALTIKILEQFSSNSHLAIYDRGDDTYHYGNGEWGRLAVEAESYESEIKAREALDDVDCDELLRHRLMIVIVP